jgi:hypothetical protein
MNRKLLKPHEVDVLLRYPFGRALKLAKAKRLPCIRLPDGAIRFREEDIEQITFKSNDIHSGPIESLKEV